MLGGGAPYGTASTNAAGAPGSASGNPAGQRAAAFHGRQRHRCAERRRRATRRRARPDSRLPPVRVVADEKNNTLVIYARPRDYHMIEEALEKIDVVPLQVLIEATIAEVTLNNDLHMRAAMNFFQSPPPTPARVRQHLDAAFTPRADSGGHVPWIQLCAQPDECQRRAQSAVGGHQCACDLVARAFGARSSIGVFALVGNAIPIPTAQIQSTALRAARRSSTRSNTSIPASSCT